MKRQDRLDWPGLAAAETALRRELREARWDLEALRNHRAKLKRPTKLIRDQERKVAQLVEGVMALRAWKVAELGEPK